MNAWSQKSDVELVELYRQRNSEALAELMGRYLPGIHKNAMQYQDVLDFDDLVQEGCIGLLDAVRSFHRDNHTQFSTYAMVCIRNRMRKAVEKCRSNKARLLTESLPLDDAAIRPDSLTPEKICMDKETLAAVMEAVHTELSLLERQILFASLSGENYQTIADCLNISPKSVDNALQRVRRKLKSIHRP
ncbi:MAG: sigma-70 family RNA polymerase sigma factor [Candidatus Merdivicinus sp.]